MSYFEQLLSLAERIPATFWGVVVGSFFSILGVWLGNRSSERRLRVQFDLERQQKAREREVTLKREIYLEAVTELALSIRAFNELSNAHKSDEEIFGEVQRKVASAQLVVVAGAELAMNYTKLQESLKVAFWRVYPRRVELLILKRRIDGLNSLREEHEKQQSRILEEMRQLNLSENTERPVWEMLEKQFDYGAERVGALIEEGERLFQELTAKQLDLGKEARSELEGVRQWLVSALKCVRDELDLPIEESALMLMLADGEEASKAVDLARNQIADLGKLPSAKAVASGTEVG